MQAVIAMRSDMLVMSTDGPLGAYLNSCGYVHEIVTLLKVNGLYLVGHPSEEYNWFPGYVSLMSNLFQNFTSCTYRTSNQTTNIVTDMAICNLFSSCGLGITVGFDS